jgi:transposase
MSRGKQFDREFKKDIAKLFQEGKRTASSLAAEVGVHENTIYKWADAFAADPDNAFPGSGNMKPAEDELRRAQRRIRELEEENDILKKAAAYFAKHSK